MALPVDKLGKKYDEHTSTLDPDRVKAYAAATNDDNEAYTSGKYAPPVFGVVPTWDGMLAASFLVDAITRKGATSDQIKDGLDSIDLDTPQGHYTFTPQKHSGMPDSTNLMAVINGGNFVPAGLSADQLAKAGQ